jgi:hypothetical protein
MFERYSENARRVLFFAKYEAANLESPYVEPEHLLLGLLREDKLLASRLPHSLASIREKIAARPRAHEKNSASSDVPLGRESKHVLMHAAMEAETRAQRVDTAHILLGLLHEEKSFAAELLRESLGDSSPRLDRHEYPRPVTFTLKAVNPKLAKANSSKPSAHHEGPPADPRLGRHLIFENMTIAEFVKLLPQIAPGYIRRAIVLDATGLEGAWDFTLNFSIAMARKEPGTVTLFEAIEDQLGLRLE